MFPLDLALKIEEADKHATKYRYEKLSMHDREIIMGALSHLLAVPKQRNEIMIRVKRMQSEMTYHFRTFEGTHEEPIRFVLHVHAIYGDMFLKTKNAHCSCLLLLLTMSVFAYVLICTGNLPI
jgi:hypothetical protein